MTTKKLNGGNEIGISARYYERKTKKIFKHQLSTLASMELSVFFCMYMTLLFHAYAYEILFMFIETE